MARIGGTLIGTALKLVNSSGENNEGRLFSFGPAAGTNRSLGALSTEGTSLAFGVALINKAGKTIDHVTVACTAEIWRGASRNQDVFPFFYGVDGDGINDANFLTNKAMLPYPDLDLKAPDIGKNKAEVDGKAADNRAGLTATLANLQWPPDGMLFLAWRAMDIPGKGAGLAIDDLSIKAN